MTKDIRLEGVQAATELIEAFGAEIQTKSEALPSTRCVSKATLGRVLLKVRNRLSSPLRRLSGQKLINLLEQAGIVQVVPISPLSPKIRPDSLYTIGIDGAIAGLEPAELLQAHIPNGIVCYFSAIQIHELSTQPAPHHHIAKIRSPSKHTAGTGAQRASDDRAAPLGTLQFSYEDVPYLLSQRDKQWMQSTQRRYLNPFSQIRVTTLEQTLLDCLHRPLNAGGPSIVFEAWENGLERIKPASLITLAKAIGDPTLIRRVGYMLDQNLASAEDRSLLNELRRALPKTTEVHSLLPGLPYQHVNSDWNLRTP